MMRRTRRGQTTVEFALVFLAFALLIFGVIEVGRAVYEKQALARAAETMVQTLAQADPRVVSDIAPDSTTVASAVAQANQTADLGLSATWPGGPTSSITDGYYNVSSKTCVLPSDPSGDPSQSCQFATNADGHLLIIGLPTLSSQTKTYVIRISVPYLSYLEYPLQFLGGQAQETVAATTRCGQDSNQCLQ